MYNRPAKFADCLSGGGDIGRKMPANEGFTLWRKNCLALIDCQISRSHRGQQIRQRA
ncbi:hypothetical protein PROAA_1690003 [Candidatus Propionivibrio aalborgensis]|uniref:Uncharacterized protein n=1 Tax=Candidatus Propionivibrio aalborgensis TaxID=1860101 RepID=A0A1A8XPJ1_9RHOO|nr:hypothetical protein PROAA_1690003 [Candidatus Propionivibrio aalborgensis]